MGSDSVACDVAPTTLRRSWILAGILCLVGIGLAAELTLVHARVKANPATRSFCTLSEHVSCDRTAQSAYATFLGVPMSLWGLLTYALLLVLTVWGWRSRKTLALAPFAAISLFCALMALLMAYFSVVIRNLCIVCLASWIVDFALVGVAWKMVRLVGFSQLRREVEHVWRTQRLWLLAAGLGAVSLIPGMRMVTPEAWGRDTAELSHSSPTLTERARSGVDTHLSRGLDEAGHPYIGASQPKLTIVEFADYQCPHCANAHAALREQLAKYPLEVRLVHRHFPLDHRCNSLVTHPFHVRACGYAKLAACASLVGKFWPANDWLFEHGRDEAPVTPDTLAKQLDIDASQLRDCVDKAGADIVKADVEEGLRYNVQGTPTFIVEGKVYPGHLPAEALDRFK
jgi:protein-disulfide isomerase/uncharacterized membrane protein